MVDFIPGIASLFIAGLGQVLKGQLGRGVKIFLTLSGLGLANLLVQLHLDPVLAAPLSLILWGAWVVLYFAQLADAIEAFDLDRILPYL